MLRLRIRARPAARLHAAWTCGRESALRNRQRGRPVAKTAVAVVADCQWGGRQRLSSEIGTSVCAFSQTNDISLHSMRMRTLSCYSESGAEPYGAVGAVGRWDRWGRSQGPHSGDSAPTTRHAARRAAALVRGRHVVQELEARVHTVHQSIGRPQLDVLVEGDAQPRAEPRRVRRVAWMQTRRREPAAGP